ncbi:MAG: endonuclease/exonuclease/phosphatase family protein, partial [Flavobacteriales bacterium]
MKINIIALSLLSLLSFGSCSQTDRTIAFYNIENLFDTINSPSTNDSEYLPNASKNWDSGKYFEKIKHINEVVAKLNSPII